MAFITKPNFVQPKTKILANDINKIIQGLIDIENYLENLFGLIFDHIEYGKVENISTDRVGYYTYEVFFKKSFNKIPIVLLTIENLDSDVDINIWVSNVSLDKFILNVKVIRPKRNAYCNVNYLAIA